MTTRLPSQQEEQPKQGQAQTGAQQGQQSGQQAGQQQSQQSAGAPPTNEQLIQFLMTAKGLTRETAGQEVAADPDAVKQVYEKVKQLMQSGGQQQPAPSSGSGGQQSSQSGQHEGSAQKPSWER